MAAVMGVLSHAGFGLIVVLGLVRGNPVWLTETVAIIVGNEVPEALGTTVVIAVLDWLTTATADWLAEAVWEGSTVGLVEEVENEL